VVLVSIVFKSLAAALPDDTVTPTLEAVSIVLALIAEAISAAVPVRLVTTVASTTAVVFVSIVLRSVAAADPDSETPTPGAVLMPAEVIADLTFAVEPQINVNPVASTTAVVFASIVLRAVAGAVPALSVTPTPAAVVIPLELMAVATFPAVPVSVRGVAPEALVT
jgi:hypothetical protein